MSRTVLHCSAYQAVALHCRFACHLHRTRFQLMLKACLCVPHVTRKGKEVYPTISSFWWMLLRYWVFTRHCHKIYWPEILGLLPVLIVRIAMIGCATNALWLIRKFVLLEDIRFFRLNNFCSTWLAFIESLSICMQLRYVIICYHVNNTFPI